MTTLKRNKPSESPPGSASSRARQRMQRVHGVRLPTRPKYEQPTVPSDLDDLGDGELMKLFSQLTAWAAYTAGQLACAEVDERHSETEMDKQRALAALKEGTKSVTEAKARAWEAPEFVGAQEWYFEAHAYRKLLQVVYDNADRFANLVSRELTRRVSREPTERRERRYSA